MRVREARREDVARCVEMGVRFLTDTGYDRHIAVNEQAMAETLRMLMDSGVVFLLETDTGVVGGMIGVALFDHPVSGEKFASELFWWVEPEVRGSGVRLLGAAERWAREHDAVALQMIAPNLEVEKLYERLGDYNRLEVMYQKSLR